MGMKVFSAAMGHGIFQEEISRDKAWQRLTEMFYKHVFSGGSLIPGDYHIKPNKKKVEGQVHVGDIYTYSTFNTSGYTVHVLEWNPFKSLAYEEQFQSGSDPNPTAIRRMDVELSDGTKGLVLAILRREKEGRASGISTFTRLVSGVGSRKNRAKENLEYALNPLKTQLGLKSLEIIREDQLIRDF